MARGATPSTAAEKEKGKGPKIKGLRGGVSVLWQANRR
jgi:hypothetical protein